MKTIIIEDDATVLSTFLSLIEDFCPDLEVLETASNVEEGLKILEKQNPELLFLDIEMPDGTGFDLLAKLPEIDFKVIFTTAHEKYALQAIKFSALDFLLKPIDPDDLIQAVEKAQQEFEKEVSTLKIKTLLYNMETQGQNAKRIVLKDKYGLQIINIEDIIRLEAEGSYTKFILKEAEAILISKTLKEYEVLLPNRQFFRSHQSHLVNLDYLTRYDKRNGDKLILKDGSEVPISSRKKEVLLDKIQGK